MKKLFFKIHKWVGLAVLLLLLLQAATGTAIAFRYELDRVLFPERFLVEPGREALGPDALIERARAAGRPAKLDRLSAPAAPDDAVLARYTDTDGAVSFATFDPYTGRRLAAGGLADFPLEGALYLHANLLLGLTGDAVLTALGLCLFVMGVTGLVLWWPPAARFRAALRLRLGEPYLRQIFNLHSVLGAWSGVFLLFMSLTGAMIASRPLLTPALQSAGLVSLPLALTDVRPEPADVTSGPPVAVSDLVAETRARFPDSYLRELRLAGPERGLVGVLVDRRDTIRGAAVSQAWFDGRSGRLLDVDDARRRPALEVFLDWLIPVHSGRFLGWPGRAWIAATGVCLLVIGVTGFLLWLKRSAMRRRARRARRARPARSAA